jgi:DNA (cytosine-5)-methyltransferase 1
MGLENQHVNAGCPLFVPAKGFYETGFAQYKQSDVGGTIKASGGVMGGGSETFLAQPIASHDVAGTMLSRNTSGGFSNSIDHAAGGYMAIQPIALAENTIGRKPENGGNGDGFTDGGPMYTLNATGVHGVAQPIPFGVSEKPDVGHCLRSGASKADKHESTTYVAQSMAVCLGGQHPNAGIGIDQSPTLTNAMGAGGGHVPITNAMAVRRLTPVECERLQGFPDTYTDIMSKGKATPDGPRYKALGNSMAVPVMAWIGKRINEVEQLCKPNK